MRKYFIASGAAIAVFAMSAFASSLTVDGQVLQAGQDVTLTCSAGATITYGNQTNGDGEFAVNSITVTFDDAGCDGQYVNIATFSDNPQDPGGADQTGFVAGALVSGDAVTVSVNPSDPNAEVEKLNGISVLVKSTDDGGGTPFKSGIFA